MEKHLITLILFLFWGQFSLAQTPLSLEQTIDLAVRRNFGLKNQAINVSIADKELEKLRAGRQPVISGNGDLRYNPILQTVIIPGEAFGQPGDSPEKVRFGTRFNLLAGVDASWKAVDPTFRTAEAASLIEGKIESLKLIQNTLQVALEAAEAFYDVIFQMTRVQLGGARRSRAAALEKITWTAKDAGAVMPIDSLKSAVELQRAEAQYQQAQNQLQRARLYLGHLIGMDESQIVLPDDMLALDTISISSVLDNLPGTATRTELEEAQLRLDWNQLQVTLEEKRQLPVLEFYANMSAQHLSDAFSVWNRWFPFSFVGVRTSIPLYDGQRKARQKELLLFREQIARNQLSAVSETLAFEIETAFLERDHALISMRDEGRNLDLARGVLQIEQTRLEEGVLLFADFREAEYALREAESAYLSAVRAYAVAQLRCAKAIGQIR